MLWVYDVSANNWDIVQHGMVVAWISRLCTTHQQYAVSALLKAVAACLINRGKVQLLGLDQRMPPTTKDACLMR